MGLAITTQTTFCDDILQSGMPNKCGVLTLGKQRKFSSVSIPSHCSWEFCRICIPMHWTGEKMEAPVFGRQSGTTQCLFCGTNFFEVIFIGTKPDIYICYRFRVYFVTGCGLCCFNAHVNVRKMPTKWQTAYESYEFEIRNADTKLPWLFLKVSGITFVFGAQDLLMYMLPLVVFGPVNITRKSVSVGQCTQARIICWQRFVLAFIVVLACRIANLPTQPPTQVHTS